MFMIICIICATISVCYIIIIVFIYSRWIVCFSTVTNPQGGFLFKWFATNQTSGKDCCIYNNRKCCSLPYSQQMCLESTERAAWLLPPHKWKMTQPNNFYAPNLKNSPALQAEKAPWTDGWGSQMAQGALSTSKKTHRKLLTTERTKEPKRLKIVINPAQYCYSPQSIGISTTVSKTDFHPYFYVMASFKKPFRPLTCHISTCCISRPFQFPIYLLF